MSKEPVPLGKLITEPQGRDAVHIAIAPVTAVCDMGPATKVDFVGESRELVGPVGPEENGIGIIDPFLSVPVCKGEKCFLCLYPNTITSLRHEWTHPAFPSQDAIDKSEAEKWMCEYANDCRVSVEELISATRKFVISGEYYVEHGTQYMRDKFYENQEQFWKCYEAITGETVSESDKEMSPFSCSC